MSIEDAIQIVGNEAMLEHSKRGYDSMKSIHGGYALTLEELDEVWDAIKNNNREQAVREMKQVAATAIRFISQFS